MSVVIAFGYNYISLAKSILLHSPAETLMVCPSAPDQRTKALDLLLMSADFVCVCEGERQREVRVKKKVTYRESKHF